MEQGTQLLQFVGHINMFDKLKNLYGGGLELCTWGLQFQLFLGKSHFLDHVVCISIYFKVCDEWLYTQYFSTLLRLIYFIMRRFVHVYKYIFIYLFLQRFIHFYEFVLAGYTFSVDFPLVYNSVYLYIYTYRKLLLWGLGIITLSPNNPILIHLTSPLCFLVKCIIF